MQGNFGYNINRIRKRKLEDVFPNNEDLIIAPFEDPPGLNFDIKIGLSYVEALMLSDINFNLYSKPKQCFGYMPYSEKDHTRNINNIARQISTKLLENTFYDEENDEAIQESNFADIKESICRIVSKITFEKRTKIHFTFFTMDEFADRQAEFFSAQFFREKEMKKTQHPIDKVLYPDKLKAGEPSVLHKKKLYKQEAYSEYRHIIGHIALLAKNSKVLSEMIVTRYHLKFDDIEDFDGTQTVIGMLCAIINSHIMEISKVYENVGIARALSDLLAALTTSYGEYEYEKIEVVDENLELLFKTVLSLATYDMHTMINVSESFVNISKNGNRINLLKKMCISYPASHQEVSNKHLHRLDRNGCQYSIFFMLVSNVIPFLQTPHADQMDQLLKLTFNVNALIFMFFVYELEMRFLMSSEDPENCCACFRDLVHAVIILNRHVLKYPNPEPRYIHLIEQNAKSMTHIINQLLRHHREVVISVEKFFPYALNEIYSYMKYHNITASYNLFKEKEVINLYDNLMMKEVDVEKMNLPNNQIPDSMEVDDDSGTENGFQLLKELWNEIIEGFKKDDAMFKSNH